MFLIIILYAICASTFTLCKAVLMYVKPIFLVGVRMSIAGLLLLGYQWFVGRKFTIYKKDRWLFLQIIFFHVYFAYILDVWALQFLFSSKSCFYYNLSPFIAALLSYVCFAEKMTSKKWLGLGIGFSGFLPAMFHTKGVYFSLTLPDIVMMFAVISAVYGWITMRKLVHIDYSPIFVNGVGMVGGGLLALVTSYFMEGWSPAPVTELWPFIGLTLLLILAANIIFYNFYGYLLRTYTATFLSFAGFTTPLFAALFGWLFLDETVSWHFFFSLLVVCVGLYLFYQEELRQGYISNTSPNKKVA